PFRWQEIWAQNPQIHQHGRKYVDSVGRTIVLVYSTDCLAGLDTHVAAVAVNPMPIPEPTSNLPRDLGLLGLGFLMGLVVFRLYVARVNRQNSATVTQE
ncbi:MAG: PEP-CTERM sorting domain-containing protein, partial [bacterium]|nr:PEP-CTERM sorting domain-containing protein [bacterium]